MLVEALSLDVGLWVVAGGQVSPGSNESAVLLPEPQRKLRPLVSHNVTGESMCPEDMLHHNFGKFLGKWQFRKGNELCHLGESVRNCKNCGVALRPRVP